MTRWLVLLVTLAPCGLGCAGGSPPRADHVPPSFLAATGFSDSPDPVIAAETATRQMLAKLGQTGQTPVAVIFLERTGSTTSAQGRDVGARIKALTGAAVYGHGGTGLYGPTWGDDVEDQTPTFLVLGLAGSGLDVAGHVTAGTVEHTWSKELDDLPLHRAARDSNTARGIRMGQQIPRLEKPGAILLLGAHHNWWHTYYCQALSATVGSDVPIIGGFGQFTDYVYADGQKLVDAQGNPSDIGQLAIVIQGDLQIRLGGMVCRDTFNPNQVLLDAEDVAAHILEGEPTPQLLLAFSCVTRLRNGGSALKHPGVEYARMRELYGDVPIFGAYCGGEVGTDNAGQLSTGGDRLMVASISARRTLRTNTTRNTSP